MKNTRWLYTVKPIGHGCFCNLTSDLHAVRAQLGLATVSDREISNLISTDADVSPELLGTTTCRVTRMDMRENRRELLRWVVSEYGRDVTKLRALGFVRQMNPRGWESV